MYVKPSEAARLACHALFQEFEQSQKQNKTTTKCNRKQTIKT